MAHICPDCHATCHCGGDIDDINFGERNDCIHYQQCQMDDFDEDVCHHGISFSEECEWCDQKEGDL